MSLLCVDVLHLYSIEAESLESAQPVFRRLGWLERCRSQDFDGLQAQLPAMSAEGVQPQGKALAN